MKQQRVSAAVVAVAAAVVLAGADTVLANGGQFFIPAGRGAKVELVYFGRVKDARTGRPIPVKPYVGIVDPFSGIFMPFQGDSPGHFRSPDVGAAILEVAPRPFDTSQFEITVSATGYETTKVKYIPRQSKGAVELNVKMQPKGNAGTGSVPPAAGATQSSTTGGGSSGAPADSSKPTFFLLAACFGLAAISAVARTVNRRASTEH